MNQCKPYLQFDATNQYSVVQCNQSMQTFKPHSMSMQSNVSNLCSMQSNAIQSNAIQCNPMQFNPMQSNVSNQCTNQCRPYLQFNAIIFCSSMQSYSMQSYSAVQCDHIMSRCQHQHLYICQHQCIYQYQHIPIYQYTNIYTCQHQYIL